jgi:tRNA threonylcarbamoyladenosine biosynthesis protein TsaE
MTEIFETRSERETFAVAENLAATLDSGSCVLLFGDLGAGKTAFVRGLAAGLGAKADEVSSPTFVIMQHYRGRLSLTHVDLYRLESPAEVADLGLEEIAADGVLAVEWAERMPAEPPRAVHVRIQDGGGDLRTITIDR